VIGWPPRICHAPRFVFASLLDAGRAAEDRMYARTGQELSAEQPGLGRFEFRLAEHALLAQPSQII
jgi:hypothetical protein